LRTKVCFKCHQELAVVNFYKHPMMGDGYLGKCKECAKRDVRENRKSRKTYYDNYDRKRSRNPERIAWVAKRPLHKRRAMRAVHSAINKGRMVKMPCEVCGELRVDAHHPDYSKPLEVMWLCRTHHAQWHVQHGFPE